MRKYPAPPRHRFVPLARWTWRITGPLDIETIQRRGPKVLTEALFKQTLSSVFNFDKKRREGRVIY